MTDLEKAFSVRGFVTEMRRIKRTHENNPELCHIYMDECMCDLLRELGYGEGIDIFEDTELWYS